MKIHEITTVRYYDQDDELVQEIDVSTKPTDEGNVVLFKIPMNKEQLKTFEFEMGDYIQGFVSKYIQRERLISIAYKPIDPCIHGEGSRMVEVNINIDKIKESQGDDFYFSSRSPW